MSGASLSLSSRPRRRSSRYVPAQLVDGWLRNTATSGSVGSVADQLLNNPATATGTDRPTGTTSANGTPVLDFDGSTSLLSWPVAANNNQVNYFGLAMWVNPDIVTAQQGLVCTLPGATNKFELTRNNADLLLDVYHSQFVSRRAVAAGVFSAGVGAFVTWEWDKDGATEADKCILTAGAVELSSSYSNSGGTPNGMPSALVSTVGPHLIGCRVAASHTGCFDGKIVTVYTRGSKMLGATRGIWTPQARRYLMNLERPF